VKKYEDYVKKKTACLEAGKCPDVQNRPNKTETGKDNRQKNFLLLFRRYRFFRFLLFFTFSAISKIETMITHDTLMKIIVQSNPVHFIIIPPFRLSAVRLHSQE
jgi:hypothetical protein